LRNDRLGSKALLLATHATHSIVVVSLFARAVSLGALLLLLAGLPSVAAAKKIMVFGPHPDDESILAAGRVAEARAAGHTVKIVVVTNGDFSGIDRGLARQGDSVAAARLLNVDEQDVIFLGYPDGSLMTIYNAPSPTDVITSNAGQRETYGTRGMGGMDYHRGRFGSPGPYNRVTMEQDFRTLLEEFRPDEVYTVSHFDTHGDHQATAIFVTEALAALKRADATLTTQLLQGIVWVPSHEQPIWPHAGGCAPDTPFTPPQMQTQLEWKRTLRATVLANLKCDAINAYVNAVDDWLRSFARKDEFFWLNDFGANLAIRAQVSASSQTTGQGPAKAVDGFADGAPHDAAREWVSAGQLAGAWIQLDWTAPVSLAQINLHDRPHGGENVLAGTLSFSDGTSIAVGALPTDGKLLAVTFAPKTVSWVRFTVNQAQGSAAGLSEIQALGLAAQSANVAPHFLEGPGGNTDKSIISAETATFSVQAHDLNGDAVRYEWSADGGTISGSGASAVFTPPAVTESKLFTITARILDDRGGSATSVGFVTVAPAVDEISVSPTVVPGGDGAQGTVRLSSRAPPGGLSVPLSSSNPSAAQVPASVTVPGDAVSVTFPVTTSTVSARVDVTLSANIRGTMRTAALAVTPRASGVPSGNLLLSPDAIGDGNWVPMGAIRATPGFAPAPDGTQNASRVETTEWAGHALAQAVNVAENTSYTFSFFARNNGGGVASYSVHCNTLGADIIAPTSYFANINASGWTQVSATFKTPAGCTNINVYPVRDSGHPVDVLLWRATLVPANVSTPPALASLSVSPPSVSGGGSATGTATLSAAAPDGGAQVTLSSDNAAVTVPASVTVPAGATSANFNVSTSAVSTPTSATISGSYGGATKTAPLAVVPALISSLSISPSSVAGGTTASGTVTLNGPAPAGGAQVALSSNSGAASVPASVTVPAGAASATFTITTTSVSASTSVTISGSYGGATQTGSLTVLPPAVASLSLSQASVTGGTAVTGTVILGGPAPAGGAQVALSSNNPAATVPASVTVAAGATSATFNVATSAVAASTSASISASYGGGTQSVSLTVLPPVPSALSISPTSVTGGTGATGTVTLSGPAPAGGAQVALSDNSGAASVPASVTVPAGATSASFSIGTSAVADNTAVTISASYGGATRSATLTVLHAVLASLTLNPTSVVGGPLLGNSTGRVTLNGPAPAGGAVVALSDNSGACSTPGSVTVAAGATSATFTVTTSIVLISTNCTVTATYKGTSRSASLQITL
jgi:LmbE family N-acetylglucosaminyl deacetylase